MIAATPAHAPALAALHEAAFPPRERWGADTFALQLELPGVFGWIEEAAGFVLARAIAGEAEILTIAVHPEARRRGVGRRLLAAAAEGALLRDAGELFLEVSHSNDAARALYLSAGFIQVGLRVRYYPDGSDALVMRRAITSGATEAG